MQPNVLVAMVDVLIGNEGVGQSGQTGKVGRIGLDGRILQLLDYISQALDQIVLWGMGKQRKDVNEKQRYDQTEYRRCIAAGEPSAMAIGASGPTKNLHPSPISLQC